MSENTDTVVTMPFKHVRLFSILINYVIAAITYKSSCYVRVYYVVQVMQATGMFYWLGYIASTAA